AATGILIQAGEGVLAEGAALLFVTNLLAIAVSALIVLLATGVVPAIRLCFASRRIAFTTTGVVVALAVIAVPLTARSLVAATSSRQREQVAGIVAEWLGPADLEVTELEIVAERVTVELSGLDEPPPAYELATRLAPALGERA